MPRDPPVTTATWSFNFRESIRSEGSKVSVFRLCSDGAVLLGRCRNSKLSTLANEARKERLRYIISLPAQLRMPLHAEHKTIAARIFHSFDQAIRGPGGRHQFPSQSFNCL